MDHSQCPVDREEGEGPDHNGNLTIHQFCEHGHLIGTVHDTVF